MSRGVDIQLKILPTLSLITISPAVHGQLLANVRGVLQFHFRAVHPSVALTPLLLYLVLTDDECQIYPCGAAGVLLCFKQV